MIDVATVTKVLATRQPSKASCPELLQVLGSLRLLAGVAVGVVCGILGLTGWAGFLLYAVVAVGGLYVLYTSHLEADVDSYGAQALLMEGLQPGLGMALLIWTVLYQF